jgi:hypothetical protein
MPFRLPGWPDGSAAKGCGGPRWPSSSVVAGSSVPARNRSRAWRVQRTVSPFSARKGYSRCRTRLRDGRDGRSVSVEVSWEGTGPIEATSNTTIRPGFTGHFQGKLRDAVATGTVVVDGATLVDGSTTNAEIETLEDTNITTGSGG